MAGELGSLYKTKWNKFEDAMNKVARIEVCRAFLWLYQGAPRYVGDYLKDIPGGKTFLSKDENATLSRREPPTDMDISLLYRLLQRTCGLAEANDPTWYTPPATGNISLEHTLYLIKEERNKIGHEGHKQGAQAMSDAELEKKLDYLRFLCSHLLTESAQRCGRLDEIVKVIDNMEARLLEIRGVTAERFIQMAKEELRKERSKMADEWYQQPLLSHQGQPMALDDLLQWLAPDGGAPRFFLVTGEAGSGKSSLCRYLERCWLGQFGDGKDLLQRYQLVLLNQCEDVRYIDPVRLLKEELLPDASLWCSSDTLIEFLRSVPTLWVMDGLEEATREALRLIDSLLRKPQLNSTVLMTARPDYGRDFLRRYPADVTQLSVSLLGADPLEAIQNIVQRSKECDKEAARHAKSLMKEFEKLDSRVQQELRNPLKLRLTLQGWETLRTSTFTHQFDLSRLYLKFTDEQKKSLSDKLWKSSTLINEEATRKVSKWFLFLCECAFQLVHSRNLFTDATIKEFLRKLEDKCDELRISSSRCLSTFLCSPDSMFFYGNTTYTFYHDTQMYFLAALYIDSILKASNDLLSDTIRLFNFATLQEYVSEEPPLRHFLEALLLLVSLTGDSTSDDIIRMVVKLLLNAIPLGVNKWAWFAIAKKASYESRIMREISRVIPKDWVVMEGDTEAARRLLEFQQPKRVLLNMFSNPEEVKELEPLIYCLASLPIDIRLHIKHHILDLSDNGTADKYLEIICREESPCVLVSIEGHLGEIGYDLLRHPKIIDSCEKMIVKVKSVESLESLCKSVRSFESLASLDVVIAMKEFPFTSARLPTTKIKLVLPCMTEETVKDTSKFIARLSRSYDILMVPYMAYRSISNFLDYLINKDVKIKKFCLIMGHSDTGKHKFDFGPLPLDYSMEKFQQLWDEIGIIVCRTLSFTPR